jgi:hypothetical protein
MTGVVEVRRYLRRRQRDADRGADRWESAYTIFLIIVMFGFGIWSQIHAVLGGHSTVAFGVREASALAAGVAWVAAVVAASGALGPVAVSGAALQWLFTTPLDRRRLLTPAAFQAFGVGLLAGLVQGLLALTLSTAGAVAVLCTAVAGGLLVVAAAMLVQGAVTAPARRLSRAATVLAVAAAAVGGLSAAGVRTGPVAYTGPWGWPLRAAAHPWLAVVVGCAAVVLSVFSWYRLSRVTLATLIDATSTNATATAIFVTMDPGLASRAAEDRRWRSRHLGPDSLPHLRGPLTAMGQDLLLLARTPVKSLFAVALISVPVLATGLPVSGWVIAFVLALAGLTAVAPSTVNARRDHDEPALARLLGLSDANLFAGRMVVPALVATAWSTLAVLAVGKGDHGTWAVLGALAGPALAAGALRAARRGQVRHDFSPVVTPAGLIPTGPIKWLVQGLDLTLLAMAPTLIAVARHDPAPALRFQAVFSASAVTLMYTLARRGPSSS